MYKKIVRSVRSYQVFGTCSNIEILKYIEHQFDAFFRYKKIKTENIL